MRQPRKKGRVMNNRKKMISIFAGIMAAVLLPGLLLGLTPNASAASSSEIKNQINDLKEERDALDQQIEDLYAQYQENEDEILNIISQKSIIDREMAILYEQIDNMNDQLAAYNLLIADKQEELEKAQADFRLLSLQNKERIRAMEEEGSVSYWSVLFKAKSFADLLDRLNMIQEIAAADRKRLAELDAAAQVVEGAQDELEAEKAELELAKAELDTTHQTLDQRRQEAEELLNQLVVKGREMEGLQEKFHQEKDDLLTQIAQKEQEYNDARAEEERQFWEAYWATYTTPPTTAPPTTVPPTTVPTETTAPNGETENGDQTDPSSTDPVEPTEPGETTPPTEPPTEPTVPPGMDVVWLVPCSYRKLTSPYGQRESPTAGASTFHQGVDLSGAKGTPIVATRSGTVTASTYSNAGGNFVTINHGDGFSSSYLHMTHDIVSPGQFVNAGQVIGYMGDSGIVTGVHLHFSIYYKGKSVNPAIYVRF